VPVVRAQPQLRVRAAGGQPGAMRARHHPVLPAVEDQDRHRRDRARPAELIELRDPACAELRQAMLDWYVPRQGPEFESWLDALDAVAARIEPAKMFTFSMNS